MKNMDLLERSTALFSSWGAGDGLAVVLGHVVALLLLVGVAFLADVICRHVVLKAVAKVVRHTKAKWDDVVFDHKVMVRLSHMVMPVVIYVFIPSVFSGSSLWAVDLVQRVCFVFIVVSFLLFVHAFLKAVYSIYSDKESFRNRPLKSMMQTVQVAMWFVGGIVILSELIDKDPVSLLAGLAKYEADGIVTEVTLNTVKVRNWDNTVTTIPPYALVSDAFQNWNAMRESGGRRIKRSVCIDMTSVRFCTEEMLERFRKISLLKDYIDEKEQALKAYNEANGIDDSVKVNGRRQTNLGVFRAYLTAYLRSLPFTNPDLHCMVRHLQPTDKGIPVELYFFSTVKEWVPYEGIQADVFDHVLAVIPEFGLRVFQSPSGADVQKAVGSE